MLAGTKSRPVRESGHAFNVATKMADDPPFRTEYAKSNRSSCKSCKGPIVKDSLRMAKMVQVSLKALYALR